MPSVFLMQLEQELSGAFKFACASVHGGIDESDQRGTKASSRKESEGELRVGIQCGGSLSLILPNTQSINGLKRVSQLCPRTIRQSESNEVT